MKKKIRSLAAAMLTGSLIFGSVPANMTSADNDLQTTGALGTMDDATLNDLFDQFIAFLTDLPEDTDPDEALFALFDMWFGDMDPSDPNYIDWRAIWDANNPYPMYRLYNPNSGEHFYTSDAEERQNVIAAGWNDEGIGWWAPLTLKRMVYRLYNANGGEHHYTLDPEERDMLINAGWNYEGVGWCSADETGIPVYREYNPNQFSCNHNFTQNKEEHDYLISLGWKDEGIAWYAVPPKSE